MQGSKASKSHCRGGAGGRSLKLSVHSPLGSRGQLTARRDMATWCW